MVEKELLTFQIRIKEYSRAKAAVQGVVKVFEMLDLRLLAMCYHVSCPRLLPCLGLAALW